METVEMKNKQIRNIIFKTATIVDTVERGRENYSLFNMEII